MCHMYNSATLQRTKKYIYLPIKDAVIKSLPSFTSPYRLSESGRLIMRPERLGIVFSKGEATKMFKKKANKSER